VDLPAGSSITYVIDASVGWNRAGETRSNTAPDTNLGFPRSGTDSDAISGNSLCEC
jgi:hypothetical protein